MILAVAAVGLIFSIVFGLVYVSGARDKTRKQFCRIQVLNLVVADTIFSMLVIAEEVSCVAVAVVRMRGMHGTQWACVLPAVCNQSGAIRISLLLALITKSPPRLPCGALRS